MHEMRGSINVSKIVTAVVEGLKY